MATDGEPLILVGREFEGFDRALTRQLSAAADLTARHRLIEISELEQLMVSGDGATAGDIDLALLNTDWLPNLIAQERLLPLNRWLTDDPPEGWPDAWVSSLRSLQTGPDGRIYGIAYHDGPIMLLYRADLYEDPEEQRGFEARFGYPLLPARTWTEFLDQARWFTRPADGLYGTILAGFPDAHNNVYDFVTQLWVRGADLLNADGTPALDSEAAREAIEFLHDLWHVHDVIDPAARGWDSVASGVHFANGEAAMMVNWCGFAALSADPQSPTHGLIGCVPAPAGETGTRATMNAYWVLTIPVGSKRPGDAYRMIRHLSSEAMDAITAVSGGTACRRDSWDRRDVRELAPYYSVLAEAHEAARAIPRDPRWPAIADVLNDMMRAVIHDQSGSEVLAPAQERLLAVLRA